jgi:hypothetical protein
MKVALNFCSNVEKRARTFLLKEQLIIKVSQAAITLRLTQCWFNLGSPLIEEGRLLNFRELFTDRSLVLVLIAVILLTSLLFLFELEIF